MHQPRQSVEDISGKEYQECTAEMLWFRHYFIYDSVNSVQIWDTSVYRSSPQSFSISRGLFPKLSAMLNASIALLRYHSIISPWQNMHDLVRGVSPPMVLCSGSPPSLTSSSKILRLPMEAAQWSAVLPTRSARLTLAPCIRHSLTTQQAPTEDATMRTSWPVGVMGWWRYGYAFFMNVTAYSGVQFDICMQASQILCLLSSLCMGNSCLAISDNWGKSNYEQSKLQGECGQNYHMLYHSFSNFLYSRLSDLPISICSTSSLTNFQHLPQQQHSPFFSICCQTLQHTLQALRTWSSVDQYLLPTENRNEPGFRPDYWGYLPAFLCSVFSLVKIWEDWIRGVWEGFYIGQVFMRHSAEVLLSCYFIADLLLYEPSFTFNYLIASNSRICWCALIISKLRSSVVKSTKLSSSSKPWAMRPSAKAYSSIFLKNSQTSVDLSRKYIKMVTFLLFDFPFEKLAGDKTVPPCAPVTEADILK